MTKCDTDCVCLQARQRLFTCTSVHPYIYRCDAEPQFETVRLCLSTVAACHREIVTYHDKRSVM